MRPRRRTTSGPRAETHNASPNLLCSAGRSAVGIKCKTSRRWLPSFLETARKLPPGAGRAMTVENDTEVFYSVRVEALQGEHTYIDRTGTRAAIYKGGRKLDPMSRYFCPHQWLDADGFVSQELTDQYPHPHWGKKEGGTESAP